MDSLYHGRPPSGRQVLEDRTNRANGDPHTQHQTKPVNGYMPNPRPQQLPQNESRVPNGSSAVCQELPSPENKHLSVVQGCEQPSPHSKRDSAISDVSTNDSNSSRRRKTYVGPWQLGQTIGRGGCSRVRLVRHSVTGQRGAAKIILKATAEKIRALSLANLIKSAEKDPDFGKSIPFGLEREICIMKLLDHPNIVRLYDVWENRDEIYIIMEHVEGGELFGYIHKQGGLAELHAVHIFRQMVAALIYCHRINIHHRDLKPENILLDRDNMTVKLVDFGMAALQPVGTQLTTPCGSPHYAAPEVIKSTAYDGAKADVWSCGVVLFVLLTGTPPFNYSGKDRDLKHLFRDITEARYIMPDTISREAKDLIRRILIPDPEHRISLYEIWDHPFLRKYQQELNFLGESAELNYWTGPSPVIADWTPLNRGTIDRDILRCLRTLWHSEREEDLIQKLICREPNQEKFFYAAIRKHHTDQLENYQPSSYHAVTYSNSDYHHTTCYAFANSDVEELPPDRPKRTESAYSILNNEHLHSKHTLYESPPSEASYDPYRASRQPMIPTPKGTPVNPKVRVYRGNSDRPRPITALGHRTGSSLRLQALRNHSKRSSGLPYGSSLRSSHSQRSTSFQRHLVSRSSLASSHWSSSPPVIARSGGAYKRGVSFAHLHKHRPSAATTSSWQTEVDSCDDHNSYRPIATHESATRVGIDSSDTRSSARAGREIPQLNVKKSDSPTKYIQGEARKVSMELGKVMEEAFNRYSVSPSIQQDADVSLHASQYDTPQTSFSNTHKSGGSAFITPPAANVLRSERPLPPIPVETPNSFVQRRLAETRAEIAQRFKEDGSAERYYDMLENLERMMAPVDNGDRRIFSAPAKSPGHEPLHVIPEEGKSEHGDGLENSFPRHRIPTDPVRSLDHRVAPESQQTIRLVDNSSPYIAPLNIRKRSGASSGPAKPIEEPSIAPWPILDGTLTALPRIHVQNDSLVERTEREVSAPEKQYNVIKKKKSWFRRDTDDEKKKKDEDKEKQVKKKQSNGLLRIAGGWHGSGDPNGPRPLVETNNARFIPEQSDENSDDEFPMRNAHPGPSKGVDAFRKGFLALFGKKPREERTNNVMKLGQLNDSVLSLLSDFDFEPENINDGLRAGPPEMQVNWLSRFLHIKPASAVLCLRVGRGKVRQDFARLLRDWQRFGVEDVSVNRASNSINARIDKQNRKYIHTSYASFVFSEWRLRNWQFEVELLKPKFVLRCLSIKPVFFVIELFTVLEHGCRANLCLARFTQTRGAASSFQKIFDTIEDVCRARGMLVEDEERKASMMGALG
ncbi:uncharacterized protein yc1106_08483 [Curvularia clavata]|uniref:non-specific serine/threonine protein kinase n=1 Tax=Curvularia clavata TaxID=95742 RepID=A0A9Q8ZEI0_CURCL|nr:uncharacterized protein yc1106_08483 [Curvularia clavata]